jgi:DNA-binding Lrp family transcriptional regulator
MLAGVCRDIFCRGADRHEKGLNELVIDRIQKLDGVERTEIHIVVE